MRDAQRLTVWSGTAHSLNVLTTAAREAGADVAGQVSIRTFSGRELSELVEVLAGAATSTERDEIRVLPVPEGGLHGDRLLSESMGALTLAQLASRVMYGYLEALTADLDNYHAVFQPIVSLASRQVVAHESLLRATSIEGTAVPAAELFTAARDGGWSTALDRIGREVALRDAAGWIGAGKLFINFIPTSIYRPEVCLSTTFAAAQRYGIDIDQVVFEVVETHRTEDVDHLLRIVDFYRERGASIALDDVGSGYSSLQIVAAVRPDIVKVEQELVRGVPDPASVAIVRAVIALSHELGATVVAEGIETAEQAQIMAELGADLGQGWLFGRPQRPAAG